MRVSWRRGACVLAAFLLLATVQAWPLPMHLSTHLTGPPTGDTGVYVWNMWVFRREVLEGASPLHTSAIFSLSQGADLSLHNYTTFANLVGLPLQELFGVVAAFNLVYILNVALAGFGLYLLARRLTGQTLESWLAGAMFACAPFLVTRGSAHFSLVAAAPLPIFMWLMLRMWETRQRRDAVGLGVTLAWAAYSDAYYGVYCVLLGAAFLLTRVFVADSAAANGRLARRLIDAAIVALVCLIVGVQFVGRGSLRLGPLVVSMRTLYTPMLILTVLVVARVLVTVRLRIGLRALPAPRSFLTVSSVAVIAAVLLLSPIIYALTVRATQGRLVTATVPWRSSSPGSDLLAVAAPNPNHPLTPDGLAGRVPRSGRVALPGRGRDRPAGVAPWIQTGTLLGRLHDRLRVADARPVHSRCRRQYVHPDTVDHPPVRPGHRRSADALTLRHPDDDGAGGALRDGARRTGPPRATAPAGDARRRRSGAGVGAAARPAPALLRRDSGGAPHHCGRSAAGAGAEPAFWRP
jgi:hypothetical protein